MNDQNIIGGRQLDQLLQTLPVKMEKNIMRSALRAGAAVILTEVQQRIPTDTGQLRASARITTRYRRGEVSASVKVGNFVAWYAHLVEFGTRDHKIVDPQGGMSFNGRIVHMVDHPGTTAQPFMRPAADAAHAQAVAAVTAKIRQRLTTAGINAPDPSPPDPNP